MNKKFLIIILGIILSSCLRAQTPQDADVQVISASQHCGPQAGLTLIDSVAHWQQLNPQRAAPEIDWDSHHLLIVRMGTQPNPGYSLKYEGGAVISQKNLKIPLIWQYPDPEGIYPQMIVEPCLIFSIPAQGYEIIQVLDQDNSLKFELKRPE